MTSIVGDKAVKMQSMFANKMIRINLQYVEGIMGFSNSNSFKNVIELMYEKNLIKSNLFSFQYEDST